MKKIITLLIFLFAGVTLAQTYTPYDKTEGRYWRAYKDTLLASYVYVVNDSTSLAYLDSLIADLATNKGYLLNIKTNGDSLIVLVNSTNTKLDNVITDLDSLVLLTTNIYGAVDNVEAKLDSLDASSTRIESKLDDANVGIDSLDASSTRIEGYVDGVEAKLDTIEVSINATNLALVEMNNGIDSLDAVNTRMEANQLVLLGYEHPASKYFGKRDTITTTAVDTIDVSTSTVWHSLSVFALDDELQISIDGTNWVIVPTYSTVTLSKLSSVTFTEFYIKQRDGSGNVIYDVVWIGY